MHNLITVDPNLVILVPTISLHSIEYDHAFFLLFGVMLIFAIPCLYCCE
jgi:hypothetical protein